MSKCLMWCLLGVFGMAAAAEPPSEPADPRAKIAQKIPGTKLDDVRPSPVNGIFEVTVGADTAYVTADGKYLISGDLYEVDTRINLTEAGRAGARSKALAKLDERDTIIFASTSPPPKHTITVFTDVECGYCRKLHSEIDQLNALGVRVRYMAFPRAGPGTADWRKMENVWCAKDRNAAMTQAKQGQEVKSPACGTTPVARQYELGGSLGVLGTPAIFTADGDYISGYMPPAQLVAELERLKKEKKK